MNYKKLKAIIVERGLTQTSVAKKMGISKNSLWAKVNGRSDLTISEAQKLCDILTLTPEEKNIFFDKQSHYETNALK